MKKYIVDNKLQLEMIERMEAKRKAEKEKKEMARLTYLQKEIVDREKEMTNRELFDEVINQAAGDDYDGCFTTHGRWEFEYLLDCLEKRLEKWFSE